MKLSILLSIENMSCSYNHILGVEGKGAHFHLFGIAVVDLALTILAGYLLARWLRLSFIPVFAILFATSILLHKAFCVNTTVNKAIYGEC